MTSNIKRKFYKAFKSLSWFCVAAIVMYTILSLLFLIIGQYQFHGFQNTVLSNNFLFVIPVLLIIGISGMIFFRNEEEERPILFTGRSRRLAPLLLARKYSSVFSSIIIVCLVAIALYSFVLKENYKENIAKSTATADSTEGMGAELNTNRKDGDFSKTQKAPAAKRTIDVVKKKEQDTAITPPAQTASSDRVPLEKLSAREKKNLDASYEVKYKVISKAYLYTAPDETTRRNAFINRVNNSYSTLLPKGEQDGFIYVVFSDEQGQTTMGWLRKKDLSPVRELVYNDTK
ncbi:MAG TPA: hypothetical protein VF610_01125 [Segetibacter sp.]